MDGGYQSCLSKNFSMRTENVAKPAQPTHAAFGPPTSSNMVSKFYKTILSINIIWWSNASIAR